LRLGPERGVERGTDREGDDDLVIRNLVQLGFIEPQCEEDERMMAILRRDWDHGMTITCAVLSAIIGIAIITPIITILLTS